MTLERWKRTEELYHAARSRPLSERAAFLAAACRDDEALARDVESLLNESDSDAGFLAEPPLMMPAHMVTDVAPAAMAGRSIGGYRLRTLLGAGGMGEVYLAHDAKLGRDVAIKILPRAFTSDPDRLARFEREARMLAALNHPNICAIYGLEEADGIRFLILELVEGETLAETLTHGRGLKASRGLGLAEALTIARQIADALEVAHEKGIIHRDLKPANIKITPDGVVKVLDFGLARAVRHDGSTPDLMHAPVGTREGVAMGTAAYMSPEQACGKVVDRRTDIWAFGAVVFEMVTGHAPFTGETLSDILASVLKSDPDWSALPATVPLGLRRLLHRCLEKDLKRRLQSIGDARVEIEDLLSGADESLAVVSPLLPPRRLRAFPWVVSGALAVALVGTVAWNLSRPVPPLAVTRFTLALPAGQLLNGNGGGHSLALSPDGTRMVYLATRLYLRSMSEGDVKTMPGIERYVGVREPVFSPDGGSIAFYALADQTLYRTTVTGGTVMTICAADSTTGISWGPDGIVFGQGRKGIMRVSPNGGTPEVLVRINDGETAQSPQILPGGQHVLFTLATGTARDRSDRAQILVQSLKSGERKLLIGGGSDARYVPTGHLVYALSGILYAVPFDAQRLEVNGAPVPIVEGVSRDTGGVTGAANFSLSNAGSLVYVSGPASASAPLDIGLMDRKGKVEPLKLPPGAYAWPRASPDGTRLAFVNDDDKEAIVWIYDLSGTSAIKRLTSGGNSRFPIWTSDSKRVAFQSDRDGDLAIFWQPADGGTAERLTRPAQGESHAPESWSPKGDRFLFSVTKGSDVSLWTFSLQDRKATPFGAVHSSNPTNAVFSPDGKWVAYASAERGMTTIYVQPFPATGTRYQLFAKGSDNPHHPRWSPDGKELFYDVRVTGFEAVSVTTQPTFAFGNAVAVPKRFLMAGPTLRTPYDITPDGRLVGRITAGQTEYVRSSADQIQVVLNWFEELKARVPATTR